MAAYAAAGVAAFAIAFVALCSALGAFADSQQHSDSLQLSVVEHKDPFYVLLIGSDSRKGTALYTGKASPLTMLSWISMQTSSRWCALTRRTISSP